MLNLYVQKPFQVQAMQFDGTLDSALAIAEAFQDIRISLEYDSEQKLEALTLRSMTGEKQISAGDYIVRDAAGESQFDNIRRMTSDEFAARYSEI